MAQAPCKAWRALVTIGLSRLACHNWPAAQLQSRCSLTLTAYLTACLLVNFASSSKSLPQIRLFKAAYGPLPWHMVGVSGYYKDTVPRPLLVLCRTVVVWKWKQLCLKSAFETSCCLWFECPETDCVHTVWLATQKPQVVKLSCPWYT